MADVDPDMLMRYIHQLETAIIVAVTELRNGDVQYATGVLGVMEQRIKLAEEAAEEAAMKRLH
jgi:hypothetical protein